MKACLSKLTVVVRISKPASPARSGFVLARPELKLLKTCFKAGCAGLHIPGDLGWDWEVRGTQPGLFGPHFYGHNCNSSVTKDLAETTHIKVPDKWAENWKDWGRLNPANKYNRWGKHTVPWLLNNKKGTRVMFGAKKRKKLKCTGEDDKKGNK